MTKTKLEINWATFEVCNKDKTTAFEEMCRWIFSEYFFDGKVILHSDPNNPGVEIVPILEVKSQKRISFQSKYFENNISYSKILESCEKAVLHYKNDLDIIYLYCNKDVTVSSCSYKKIVDYLNENDIEIIPITNQTILQEVMKHELIAWQYFNQISLNPVVLQDKLKISLTALGPRYNDCFNVNTATELKLNYFLCNKSAVDQININKAKHINNLKNSYFHQSDYTKYADIIFEKVKCVENVTLQNIEQSLNWKEELNNICLQEFLEIKNLIAEKKLELKSAVENNDKKKQKELYEVINYLNNLLQLPDDIQPSPYDTCLIKNQVLIVNGDAGTGKSHLFAFMAKNLLEDGENAILLLGSNYISEQQLTSQTAEILDLNLSFKEILIKLEGFAEKKQCFSYIFIDAINESPHKNIWKSGLTTIIQQLKEYPHIKLALSVRAGYEKMVFDESIEEQIKNRSIANIVHHGFVEDSINATKTFLNYYGIPFSPTYYLQQEMRNPLFLTLFCKAYSGGNYDIFSLFDKLIEKAETEVKSNCGIDDCLSFINNLLYEITDVFLKTNSHIISHSDLLSLSFWDEFGLSNKKMPIIASLCKSGLLLNYASGQTENFQLGYNLLDDFICAKSIVGKYQNIDELTKYLCDTLLSIKEGSINNYSNLDVCIVVLDIWADKYNYELFNEIAKNIKIEEDLAYFCQRYLLSFLWRKSTTVNKEYFLEFIRSFPVEVSDVFSVLIENATKEFHPLNALFLHDLLIGKELAVRDSFWTSYINHLTDEDNRLFQLVLHFDEGKTLDGLSKANTELLLVLFIWIFTSSNRFLRDKTSKAVVELLKRNFDMCLPLLKKFQTVNDTYVLQRLYGVVFGACTKCQEIDNKVYKELAEYIYQTIFDQDEVYPDILLRDYAKLILEWFLFIYPEESGGIDIQKITPPYNSRPIPQVIPQEYYVKTDYNNGYNRIAHSMEIDHADTPGMYGDFGRYVFQSALSKFKDVDIVNLFHYAMQYIRDVLGYNNKLLGEYDCCQGYYYGGNLKGQERIGKKYQWITMYNILARVSDHSLIEDWGEATREFQGAWDPYVRDFDPTLNRNTMHITNVSKIILPDIGDAFLPVEKKPKKDVIKNWTKKTVKYFSSTPEFLQIKDEDNADWSILYLYQEQKNKEYNYDKVSVGIGNNSQSIWMIAEAFLIKKEDFEILRNSVETSKINIRNLPEAESIYQLFNREYVWSSAYHNIFKNKWIEYEIESGEYKVETQIYEMPDYENLIRKEDGEISIPMVKREVVKNIPINSQFIKIAPAYSYVLWEEEYDLSQDESTCFNIPCYDLINSLKLSQKDVDGHFYSDNGDLVCFDYRFVNGEKCLLFRTDYLRDFLEKEDLYLCWKCFGEKQFFLGSHDQIWSEWSGLCWFDGKEIYGTMRQDK